MVLPEPYFSLSDSQDTSCAIRLFSEPVPQLRDSWDNTWCYRKPRRYRFPPCKASNLIVKYLISNYLFSFIIGNCRCSDGSNNLWKLLVKDMADTSLIKACTGKWRCRKSWWRILNVGFATPTVSTTLHEAKFQ